HEHLLDHRILPDDDFRQLIAEPVVGFFTLLNSGHVVGGSGHGGSRLKESKRSKGSKRPSEVKASWRLLPPFARAEPLSDLPPGNVYVTGFSVESHGCR